MKMHINGQTFYQDAEFVSDSIYAAYHSGKPWDPKNYFLVEIGSIFSAWITGSEKEKLAKLTDLDEISQFAEDLHILAVPKDAFDAWQRGERMK